MYWQCERRPVPQCGSSVRPASDSPCVRVLQRGGGVAGAGRAGHRAGRQADRPALGHRLPEPSLQRRRQDACAGRRRRPGCPPGQPAPPLRLGGGRDWRRGGQKRGPGRPPDTRRGQRRGPGREGEDSAYPSCRQAGEGWTGAVTEAVKVAPLSRPVPG